MGEPFDPLPTPGLSTTGTTITKLYQRWLPPFLVIAGAAWMLCVLFVRPPHPPIGTYIAALAFLAVVVTIWPPESKWSKASWLVAFALCFGLEISTLYQDRSENKEEQAKIRKEGEEARTRQDRAFEMVLRKEDQAFNETLQGFRDETTNANTILDNTKAIAKLSQSNLETVTGGRSFAYVVPQSHAATENEIPLMIWNKGQNALTGVSVKFIDMDNNFATPNHIAEMQQTPVEEVGTLHGGEGKMMKFMPKPRLNEKGENSYWIWIYSQNFTVYENLDFRRGKWNLPWAYKFSIMREIPCKSNKGSTCMANALIYDRSQWSDDLGDGKPTKPAAR